VALEDADGWTADTSQILGRDACRAIGLGTDCNADDYVHFTASSAPPKP
jgi:hypothetical protein